MYTRWARTPPSAWRSWAAMMLAGSLLAAIADARAWRSRCGWASSPTLAARRAKAWAGQLYARAYEPIRSGSLAALGGQAQLLQAAEVTQRRAEAI
jgi:hypothetical protein